jgi:renalase
MPSSEEVVIVGAGVSGLACARALRRAGRGVLVLERARGVGGRCATRRVEGQPVDFGVAFLHGRDPDFLAELEAVPGERLDGWPVSTMGAGPPCQPEAFSPGERRLAWAEGISAFPRALAEGLPVRLRTEVTGVEVAAGGVRLSLAEGAPLEAAEVVLATAAEEADALLATLAAPPLDVAAARGLLGLSRSQPCLAVIATYPADAPPPPWHVLYPEGSRLLQLVSHDSAKRPGAPRLVLVLQAHPAWSAAHLDDPAGPAALLAEAGRLLGPWAARPTQAEPHRWRHARNDRAAELAGPLRLTLPGGGRLGLCGDRFARGAGVEAAWRSGRAMAARILEGGDR